MSASVCRWGILGSAGIARKNWDSIKNAGNATLVAVASRTEARAKQFIDECQANVPFSPAPRAIDSYDGLLTAADVDAVYIPLPTGIRKDWVVKAAEAGKHVMVEKPCGCNAGEVEEMIAACRRNNVQFMDGVMFMHSARLAQLRDVLNDGQSVGRIRRITTAFSFCGAEAFHQSNIRASGELEPLGCLGDLGWYTIRFTLWALNYQMPKRVTAQMLQQSHRPDSKSDVPKEFSAELFFDGDVSASFYNSFVTENQQWGVIAGSKGFLHLSDFVLPFVGNESAFTRHQAAFHVDGCDYSMEEHTQRFAVREYSNNAPSAQESNLFRNFSSLVLSGRVDPHWPEIALKTQQVMDACLASARQDGKAIELSSK